MARTCKKCGREIIKTPNGFWKDTTAFLPFYCNNWEFHTPAKKKAKCKYCGRSITKKGKRWKDHTKVRPTECCNDVLNMRRKHKPI
jgi:hypothetical protein